MLCTEWGPASFNNNANGSKGMGGRSNNSKGMGGAEEAVYYSSIELAKLGYPVIVYAGVTAADHGTVVQYFYPPEDAGDCSEGTPPAAAGTVTWLHYDSYDPSQTPVSCEVFIAWRYAVSMALGRAPAFNFASPWFSAPPTGGQQHLPLSSLDDLSRRYRCGAKYLWLHDLVGEDTLPPSFFRHFDGMLVQSAFHKEFVQAAYIKHAESYAASGSGRKRALVDLAVVERNVNVIPNGITTQQYPLDGANDNTVFIFGSAPNRGLALVLHQWQHIKRAIPSATLEIYYGFTDSALRSLRASMGASFERWYAQILMYLQQDGVKYFGPVDHEVLTRAYSRAGDMEMNA